MPAFLDTIYCGVPLACRLGLGVETLRFSVFNHFSTEKVRPHVRFSSPEVCKFGVVVVYRADSFPRYRSTSSFKQVQTWELRKKNKVHHVLHGSSALAGTGCSKSEYVRCSCHKQLKQTLKVSVSMQHSLSIFSSIAPTKIFYFEHRMLFHSSSTSSWAAYPAPAFKLAELPVPPTESLDSTVTIMRTLF